MAEAPDRSDAYDAPFPHDEKHPPAHGDTMRDVIPPRPYEPAPDSSEEPRDPTSDMDRPGMDPDD